MIVLNKTYERLIVVATSEEVRYILRKYKIIKKFEINGYEIYMLEGSNGKNIAIAVLGVAKVTFAIGVQLLINVLDPKEIISLGFAGGISNDININDICIGCSSFQYDIVSSKCKKSEEDYLPHRRKKVYHIDNAFYDEIRILLKYFNLIDTVVLTGDNFVTNKDIFSEDNIKYGVKYIADQETAAFYQAAEYSNVKYATIKIVTDLCNNNSKRDYRDNLNDAGMLLLKLFENLIK